MLDVIGKMYALYAVFRPNPGHAIFACNARNTNLFLGIVGTAESAKTGTNPYCWVLTLYLTHEAGSWP